MSTLERTEILLPLFLYLGTPTKEFNLPLYYFLYEIGCNLQNMILFSLIWSLEMTSSRDKIQDSVFGTVRLRPTCYGEIELSVSSEHTGTRWVEGAMKRYRFSLRRQKGSERLSDTLHCTSGMNLPEPSSDICFGFLESRWLIVS